MAMTDIQIRNAKPKDKPYKLADSSGLFPLFSGRTMPVDAQAIVESINTNSPLKPAETAESSLSQTPALRQHTNRLQQVVEGP